MASYIPIDQIVTINPGVIGAGSNPLALNGLFIGENNLIPYGQVMEFNSADAVSDWFGSSAYETRLANVYFNGFTNCTKYPGAIFFAPRITEARAAWARGSSLKGMTLASLKAVTGTLSVTVNGTAYSTELVNLSTATSFTNAAELLTTQLSMSEAATVTWDATSNRFTITTVSTGTEASISQVTGTAAAGLGLSTATLSQGAPVNTLTDILNFAKTQSLNWALFTTIEQSTQEEATEMATWANNQNNGWGFVMSDNDPNAEMANNETCFGFLAKQAAYDSTLSLFDPNENPTFKAFVMGCAASIDWSATEGRITFAFRRQSGLATTCNDQQIAENLLGNGYSYYGAYAGRGEDNTYNIMYDGNMPGNYPYFDTFINQIYLNNQLKLAIFDLLLAMNSIPYNDEGYTRIRAAILDPVNEAVNNGTIRTGVPLSESQKTQISARVGKDISNELYSQGWYLQINAATAIIRAQRGSPSMNFFYCDGGAIQQITLPSLVII